MDIHQSISRFLIDSQRWTGSPAGLTLEYPLIEKDVLDSLAIFEMIAYLEDRFGIQIEDNDLIPENFENIAAVVHLVERLRAS